LLSYRIVLQAVHHIWTLACVNNGTQRYFAAPNVDWTDFKLHLLSDPLFKVRHQRELRLWSALDMGTLPTRLQSLLLTAVLAANIIVCVYGIAWHDSETDVLSILRKRTGSVAVVNFIPVVILSSPRNPLIKLLNISFESMNTIHRNLARLTIFEAVIHTLCFVIQTVQTS
jgi:hypothetical protein